MAFTLFCLGTDIFYPCLEKDRTMFKVASLIQSMPIEASSSSLFNGVTDLHCLSNEVNIMDGPHTSGYNVHDKIAKGLIAVLNAILQGVSWATITAPPSGHAK